MKPTDPPAPKALPPNEASSPNRALPAHTRPRSYDDGVVHYPHDDGHGHDDFHNDDVAHEHQDVDLRAIITSAIVIAVVAMASLAAMVALFNYFESDAQARQPLISPLAASPTDMPKQTDSPYFSQGVSAPPLLTNEPMALGKARGEAQKRLDSGGWVDEKAGVAHVPIGEAKKLILHKGLPIREGAAPSSYGVRPWARGEASGGRTVTVDLPDPQGGPAAPPAQEHGAPHGGAPAGEKPPAKPAGQGGH